MAPAGAMSMHPASFRDFYSAEEGAGFAPTLEVTYVVPPSAPTNVVATPASGSTALTWSASPSDGGACEQGGSCPGIGDYLVTAFVPGDTDAATVQIPVSCLNDNPCTSTVLDGLTNGVDYTFWVQAQTAFGGISDMASTAATVPAALGAAGPYPIESGALGDAQDLGVNLANGNAMLSSTDLSIAEVGLPLAITRTYNSASGRSGAFGAGQSSDLGPDVALVPEPSGSVLIDSADGSSEAFATQAGGAFVAPPDSQQALTKNSATGVYTLTDGPTGDRTYFSASGQISSEADNNGNSISFAYNTNGTVASITDTQGRVITLSYSSGLITSITDPTGRSESYGYNAARQLTSFTDGAANHWSYGYDGSGQLDQLTDPDGHVTTIAYASAPDRVASVTDGAASPLAATTTFSYYPAGSPSCPRSNDQARTVVTDPNGHPTTYYNDTAERPTMTVDANGNQTSSTWDADSNVTGLTDSMTSANTTSFTYDANDNLISTTSPAPSAGAKPVVTSYVYGGLNHYLPSAATDAQGNTTTFTYDANGNLTAVKDPTGHTSTIGVQGSNAACGARPGEACNSTDPNGATTTYGYDSLGNLTSVAAPSPLGVASATYDSLGRVVSVTDGKGQTTTYTYNGDDEVTKATYSDGSADTYTYDADGNLLSDAGPSGTTTYTYDALGRVTSETTPDGHTSSLGYDPAGEVTSFTDAGGTLGYSYDPAGNLTGVTEPGGNCGSSASGCTTFAYNNDGALVQASYPNGMTQSYSYDDTGRLGSQIAELPGGTKIFDQSYAYTGSGDTATSLISSATNSLTGVTTTYGYDALDRLTAAQVSGGGPDYLYGYDPDGNATSVSSDGGAVTVNHTYNAADELTDPGTVYDADGNETTAPNGLALAYNVQSQTTGATPPGGQAYPLGYASAGQDHLTQDGPTSLVNDLLGSAGSVSEGGVTAYFTRTPGGALVSMRIDGQSYYYVTNYQGSVVALTNSAGAQVTSCGYDPYGNLISASGTVGQPFGYAGGFFDSQSYLYHLYHFGARYYDPAYEDWTQLDPSGASPGYSYATDDPLNIADPSGECFFGICPARFFRHHWKAILIGAAGVALTAFTGGASDEAAGALIAEEAAEGVAEGAEGASAADQGAYDYATQANKLDHIFADKHNFDPLVQQFGSREAVVHQFLTGLKGLTPASGTFEEQIVVGGQKVIVRGAVVDGVTKIATEFTP